MTTLKDKKKQHYVWKFYLKPWTVDGKIWCKRKTSIFNPSLENIGQEKFFYESHKLNDVENMLVTAILKEMHPSSQGIVFSIFNIYQETANDPTYLKRNGIEDYHGLVEQKVVNIFEGRGAYESLSAVWAIPEKRGSCI